MILETNRLLLRKLKVGDVEDFIEYRCDPEVCKFQGFEPLTEEKAIKYIEKLKDGEFGEAGKWFQLGIELKSENKLIGDVGLKPTKDNTKIVEFGLSLSVNYQRGGYAREAVAGICDFLFREMKIHRIFGTTDTENISCIRLCESLNFQCEGKLRQNFWDNAMQMWRDEYLYAMLESDWTI